MAAKDNEKSIKEITERRLKNALVSIDESNYRIAIQQIDKLSKKHGQNALSNSLKALSLAKLKRRADSLTILKEMMSTTQVDIDVLHNLSKSLKELNLSEEIPSLFIKSLKVKTKNEELLTYLFFSYVYNDNFLQQKQTSTELHKIAPKINIYYFWLTLSIMLQYYTSTDEKLKDMFLNLSEKMISKRLSVMESVDEFKLYLRVLFFQERYSSILEIIDSIGTKYIDQSDVLYYKVQCHENLLHWKEMFDTQKIILQSHTDQWFAYDGMIKASIHSCLNEQNDKNSSIHISQKCASQDNNQGLETITIATTDISSSNELLQELFKICTIQRADNTCRNRSPYLANILLFIQLHENNICIPSSSEYLHSLNIFYTKFGLKQSFFQDIYPLICRLPNLVTQQFLSQIESKIRDSVESEKNESLSHEMNYILLSRYVGEHQLLSLEKLTQIFQKMINLHQVAINLENSSKFDHILILSIHILLDMLLIVRDPFYLIEALCLVRSGVNQHLANNYNLLLLSLRIQGSLGCGAMCMTSLAKLGIKHLQFDTVGYLFEHFLFQSANFNCLKKFNSLVLDVYQNNDTEISEFLNESYKCANYDKVYDIFRLRDKLRNSYFHKSCLITCLFLKWLLDINSIQLEEQDEFVFTLDLWRKSIHNTQTLFDNRDLNILQNCSPHRWKIGKLERRITFELEVLWIKFRLCLLQSAEQLFQMVRQGNLTNTPVVTNFNQTISHLEEILREADSYSQFNLSNVSTNLSQIPKFYLPPTPLIELYVNEVWDYNPIYLILKIIQKMIKCFAGQDTFNLKNELENFQKIINNSAISIQSQSIAKNFALQVNYLRNLTTFTIQISIICNTLIPFYLLIKSYKKVSQKTFSIEDTNFTGHSLFKHISSLMATACSELTMCTQQDKQKLKHLNIEEIVAKFPLHNTINAQSSCQSSTLQNIFDDIDESLQQIISILIKKSELLKQMAI